MGRIFRYLDRGYERLRLGLAMKRKSRLETNTFNVQRAQKSKGSQDMGVIHH